LIIVCGHCRYRFEVPGAEAGGEFTCPGCGRMIMVDSADQEAVDQEEGFAEQAKQVVGRKVPVVCGACGKGLMVGARLAGKTRRCPSCGAPIQIPYPDEAEEVAAQSAIAARERLADVDLSGGGAAAKETAASEQVQPPAQGPEPAAVGALEHPADDAAAPAEPGEARIDYAGGGRRQTLTVVVTVAFAAVGLAVAVGLVAHRMFFSGRRPPEVRSEPPSVAVNPQLPAPNLPVTTGPATQPVTTEPTPPPPPRVVAPKCVVKRAVADVFLADGYSPAPVTSCYWKVTAEIKAGDKAVSFAAHGRQAVLVFGRQEIPCLGVLLPGSIPSQRIARERVGLQARESRTVTLVFEVSQGLTDATMRIAGLPEAQVKVTRGLLDPGEGLRPGRYVEALPRNLSPLLRQPIIAALQSARQLSLEARRTGRSFALSFPQTGVAGAALPAGRGAYRVQLARGADSLECRLRVAGGGKRVVLYLADGPFRQITFAAP